MNRDSIRIRWLHIGILLIVLLSALPRILNLAERPLDNFESVQALNAAQLTPDPASYWPETQQTPSSGPLYEWLTGMIFQFSGMGAAGARLIPALAGFLLSVLPFLFFRRLPKFKLLLSAAFLALSPVAINLSRTAGGATLSAMFLAGFVLTFALPDEKASTEPNSIWAAILLGGALASGETAYNGLLSLLLAYLLVRWFYPGVVRSEFAVQNRRNLLSFLWLTPLVALLLATGLGFSQFGLSDLGESLVLWLRGWIPFGQLSALGFLVAGITYEPFILIMGLGGALVAWRRGSKTGKLFAFWAIAAFLTGIIYPARTAQDWIWVVIPLCFLAADSITVLFERLVKREVWIHVVSLVGIALVLVSAAVITLIGSVNGYLQQMMVGNDVLIGIALLAMLLLLSSVFVLFGLGWSWEIVWDGLGISLSLLSMVLSVSAAWNLANDRGLSFRTLWVSSSPTGNGRYFERTLENASLALTGDRTAAPVFIQGEPEPSLVWRLRKYPRYEPIDAQNAATPPILIAPEGAGLDAYGAEYFGQNFALNFERAWFGLVPPDLLRWQLTHSAPTASTGWVIFIRADIIALSDFSEEPALE